MEEFRCEDTLYQLNILSPPSNKTVYSDTNKNEIHSTPASDIDTLCNIRSEYTVIEKQVHKFIDIAKNISSQNYNTNIEKLQCTRHQIGKFIYHCVNFLCFANK